MTYTEKAKEMMDYVLKLYNKKKDEIGHKNTIIYFERNKYKIVKTFMPYLKQINHLQKNGETFIKKLFIVVVNGLITAMKQLKEDLEKEVREDVEKELREDFDRELCKYKQKYSSMIKQNKRYKKKLKVIDDFIGMFITKPLSKMLK